MFGFIRLNFLFASGFVSSDSSDDPTSTLLRFRPELATDAFAGAGRQSPPNKFELLSSSTSSSQRSSRTTISRLKISDFVSGSTSRSSNKTNFLERLRFLETLFGPEVGTAVRLSLPEPDRSSSGLIFFGRPRFFFTDLPTAAGLSRTRITSGFSEPRFFSVSGSRSEFSELSRLLRFFGPLRQVLEAAESLDGCVVGGRRFRSSSRST